MTHDRVTDFAASLVEMAKAHEMVPRLQEQIESYERRHVEDGDTIARLQIRIMDLKAAQDELTAKLRSVEVERDDASFRLLEAEDRVATIRDFLRSAQENVRDALAASDPPKAVPAPSPEPPRPTESGEVESLPQSSVEAPSTGSIELRTESGEGPLADATSQPADATPTTESSSVDEDKAQGQSEPGPIAQSPSTPSASASSGPVVSEAGASLIEAEVHGLYFGKRYYDWPKYVAKADWLANGGTEADYEWRPDSQFNRASQFSG